MPTTLAPRLRSPVTSTPTSPRHRPLSHWLLLAATVVLAALVGFALWVLVDRLTSTTQTPAATVAVLPATDPFWTIEVSDLQRQLRRAGYSLPVTGSLDPLTRSAGADFLVVSESSPLDPWLSGALQGTVITNRHDPATWNARFGADRATKMVERPLTGPGGQLDAYGNLAEP